MYEKGDEEIPIFYPLISSVSPRSPFAHTQTLYVFYKSSGLRGPVVSSLLASVLGSL